METYRFDFGSGRAIPGWRKVTPETTYTKERGFGLEGNTSVQASGGTTGRRGCLTAEKPFFFSVKVPEGNYLVTLTLGNLIAESETVVRAESRQLMRERVCLKAGQDRTETIVVNVRTPRLKNGGSVALKGEERLKWDWDDKLTLEFAGKRPAIATVEIRPAPELPTIYLAGDSTVTNQGAEPWAAWGQILPRFFRPDIAIANHAQSGESLNSFTNEHRWEKILDTLHTRDYVFIQFAHNDQKEGANFAEPFTSYTERLIQYTNTARQRGATPVLVTPMHRRRFEETGHIVNTLGDYPEAMRRLSRAEKIALIDLNAMSQPLFEAMGVEGSKRAFVHYAANTFPYQKDAIKDDTHFNGYGAYELARCVVEGIRSQVPELAQHLQSDITPFDPAHPDPIAQITSLYDSE